MPPSNFKPFDDLSKEDREAWRGLPTTRAFRSLLGKLTYQTRDAMMACAEKGEDVRVLVGKARAYEAIMSEVLSDPPDATAAPVEEPFIDPADVFKEMQ
jgi:hypothetical protein